MPETRLPDPVLPDSRPEPCGCKLPLQVGMPAPEAGEAMRRCFSRTLRGYVEKAFRSHEEFLDLTSINRGHFGGMVNGKVDPKLSMLFRCTRCLGRCPGELLCDFCMRSFGSCVAPTDSRFLPDGARTARDLCDALQGIRRSPPA